MEGGRGGQNCKGREPFLTEKNLRQNKMKDGVFLYTRGMITRDKCRTNNDTRGWRFFAVRTDAVFVIVGGKVMKPAILCFGHRANRRVGFLKSIERNTRVREMMHFCRRDGSAKRRIAFLEDASGFRCRRRILSVLCRECYFACRRTAET